MTAELLSLALSHCVVAAALALVAAAAGLVRLHPRLVHALWLLVLIKLVTPPLARVEIPTAAHDETRYEPRGEDEAAVAALRTNELRDGHLPESVAIRATLAPEEDSWGGDDNVPWSELDDRSLRATESEFSFGELTAMPERSVDDSVGAPVFDISRAHARRERASRIVESGANEFLGEPPPSSSATNSDLAEASLANAWTNAATELRAAFAYAAPVAAWVWLAGILGLAALDIRRISRFHRLAAMAERASDSVQDTAAQLGRRMGVSRIPEIALLPGIATPMLWPIGRRARVLVPRELVASLELRELESILCHELAHLRRRDHWVRALETIVGWIYWWNPVVPWARRELREREEQLCDALVLETEGVRAGTYADALLRTASFLSRSRPALPPTASGIGQAHSLRRRLTMILGTKDSRPAAPRFSAWLVLAIGGLLLPLTPSWSVTVGQEAESTFEEAEQEETAATEAEAEATILEEAAAAAADAEAVAAAVAADAEAEAAERTARAEAADAAAAADEAETVAAARRDSFGLVFADEAAADVFGTMLDETKAKKKRSSTEEDRAKGGAASRSKRKRASSTRHDHDAEEPEGHRDHEDRDEGHSRVDEVYRRIGQLMVVGKLDEARRLAQKVAEQTAARSQKRHREGYSGESNVLRWRQRFEDELARATERVESFVEQTRHELEREFRRAPEHHPGLFEALRETDLDQLIKRRLRNAPSYVRDVMREIDLQEIVKDALKQFPRAKNFSAQELRQARRELPEKIAEATDEMRARIEAKVRDAANELRRLAEKAPKDVRDSDELRDFFRRAVENPDAILAIAAKKLRGPSTEAPAGGPAKAKRKSEYSTGSPYESTQEERRRFPAESYYGSGRPDDPLRQLERRLDGLERQLGDVLKEMMALRKLRNELEQKRTARPRGASNHR